MKDSSLIGNKYTQVNKIRPTRKKNVLIMTQAELEEPRFNFVYKQNFAGCNFIFAKNKQAYKQLLDEVFVISGIIKLEVSVISRAEGQD